MPSNPQDRRSAASVRLSGGLASIHGSDHTDVCHHADKLATLLHWPPTSAGCCSHHLQPKEPDPAIDRGSVGVSFSSSHKVGSSSKRCSPEVKIRCVLAGRHNPRTIWSTLPARRVNLRGFTRSVMRMYLPRSNALRASHRTWTGPRTQRVCEVYARSHLVGTVVPCRRQPWRVHAHGRLSAIARTEVPKKVPTGTPI